jgi:deoxycitidine kinase
MLFYIEGNIGTGKTTFINLLTSYLSRFHDIDHDAQVTLEPVDEWMETEDSDGQNILQKFYGDQEKWSFAFQMNSFISRVKKIQDDYFSPSYLDMKKLLFVERSIYTDRHCFAKLCYESGKMTKLEYDIYCKWNDWLSQQFNVTPDVYIYLRCDPSINDDRIKERARSSEENIPIEYLKALHEKHDEWMGFEKDHGVPVYVIDATQNFKDPAVMDKIFEELFEFLKDFVTKK